MADKQKRLPGQELPKAIIGIHNAVDARERAKVRRTKVSLEIEQLEGKIAKLMKENKARLGRTSAGGILYNLNGYRVEMHDKEKLSIKLHLPEHEDGTR